MSKLIELYKELTIEDKITEDKDLLTLPVLIAKTLGHTYGNKVYSICNELSMTEFYNKLGIETFTIRESVSKFKVDNRGVIYTNLDIKECTKKEIYNAVKLVSNRLKPLNYNINIKPSVYVKLLQAYDEMSVLNKLTLIPKKLTKSMIETLTLDDINSIIPTKLSPISEDNIVVRFIDHVELYVEEEDDILPISFSEYEEYSRDGKITSVTHKKGFKHKINGRKFTR